MAWARVDGLGSRNPNNSAPSRMLMPLRVELTQIVPQLDALAPPKPEESRTVPHGHAAPCGIDSNRAATRRLRTPKPGEFRTIPHDHAGPCGIHSTRTATRRLGPGSMV